MKKLLLLLLLLFPLLLAAGCGRRAEVTGQAHSVEDYQTELERYLLQREQEPRLQEHERYQRVVQHLHQQALNELRDEIQHLTDQISTLENLVEEFSRPGEPEPFPHGLTPAAILEDLMENSEVIRAVLGGEWVEIREEDVHVGAQYVMAPVTVHAPYGEMVVPIDAYVFLFYHVWPTGEIVWRVQSHSHQSPPPAAGPSPWLENYLPIDGDTTVMRFYIYRDWNEIEDIIEETISRENWREEVPRLMRTHRRAIDIRDLWYDGDRLYVDLFPAPAIFFNWGTTGSWILTQTLVDSLGSLPGVAEIVVLVGGEAGHWADHFDFSQPFPVTR